MKDRFKTIRKGLKEILYIDYTGLDKNTEKEFIKLIDEATNVVLKRGNNQLILYNVENSYGSPAIVAKMKADANKSKHLVSKQAVLGITGAKAILLKGINLFAKIDIKPFSTEEEAIKWLLS